VNIIRKDIFFVVLSSPFHEMLQVGNFTENDYDPIGSPTTSKIVLRDFMVRGGMEHVSLSTDAAQYEFLTF